jgi:hypothetical protein
MRQLEQPTPLILDLTTLGDNDDEAAFAGATQLSLTQLQSTQSTEPSTPIGESSVAAGKRRRIDWTRAIVKRLLAGCK